MKLLSVNVGLPRNVEVRGEIVQTSIWKEPVAGRVRVVDNNLEGDRQSDLKAHGGPDKAVYAYPVEHYAFWHKRLPNVELPPGIFGENLTVQGLLEDSMQVGDRLRVGTAEFQISQPRMPCFKLGLRFGLPAMEKALLQSQRTGFYLRVLAEGEVGAGDEIEVTARAENSLTILELVDLYVSADATAAELRRAIDLPALADAWKKSFRRRLHEPHP